MGSLSRLIKEKGGEPGRGKTGQVKVQQIHYTKLKGSGLNFYTRSVDEVMELADTMLIAGGILQPLIVRKTDLGEYEILSGHKRKRASIYNVERGYREYEFLPCIVIDMGSLVAKKISEKILAGQDDGGDERLLDMIAEYIVICTNSTTSESSHYEKMMQAVRLAEILPAMLGDEGLKGRALRTEVAKEMKCGNGQVGRYQSIYNNLVPEAMERFRNGGLSVTLASEMAGLDEGRQKEALKKQVITAADIELLKQKRDCRTVSEPDTSGTPSPSDGLTAGGHENTGQGAETDKAEGRPAAVPDNDAEKNATAAAAIQACSAGYTPEDVRRLYDDQTALVHQFERAKECGEMTDREVWLYKAARMTRDGLKCLLDTEDGQQKIPVPCMIGDTVYSVVGEKIDADIVAGFRIDKEKTYMETEDGAFLPADRIGINFFLSRELAEKEFDKNWRKKDWRA